MACLCSYHCCGLYSIQRFVLIILLNDVFKGLHNKVYFQGMCNNTIFIWSHNINCLQVAIMTPEGSWGYPYIKISFQLTHPAQKGCPHHRNLCPLLFMNSGVGSFQLSFTSHKNQISESAVRWDGLQCMVFCPYPRRLESITVCRCHYKGSTFFSVL